MHVVNVHSIHTENRYYILVGVGLWIRKCHMLVQSPSYMSIEMFWVGTIDHEICTWSMYGVCIKLYALY